MSYIIPKRVLDKIGTGGLDALRKLNEPPSDHSESYVDSEGEERCLTCDKWLEPGYYSIEDHQRSVKPKPGCVRCGGPGHVGDVCGRNQK